MATKRRRNLLNARRRVQDEGEEEEEEEDDDVVADAGDDSQSEASDLSNGDNQNADDSDQSDAEKPGHPTSDPDWPRANINDGNPKKRRSIDEVPKVQEVSVAPAQSAPPSESTADVETMVNGIQTAAAASDQEPVKFENTVGETAVPAPPPNPASITQGESRLPPNPAQSRNAEHQEYKARRDADPSFVPNRGGFFMHDQRTNGASYASMVGSRGRGRGRGFGANGNLQARAPPPFAQGSAARWDHDLHETVIEPKHTASTVQTNTRNPQFPIDGRVKRPVNLSKSTTIGTVLVRVFLPTMTEPINIDKKLTVKQHTKLPDLRPPLRRDKPIRVSLPSQTVRYIFPSVERSFIFIPRAQRPNQQRNRSRNRGYHAGSRRTSVFGESNYSPSVAMSRRSSLAHDGLVSPAGSMYGRPPLGVMMAPSRPVVKLPGGAQSSQGGVSPSSVAAISASGTPFVSFPQGSVYPLPSQPTYREHRSSQMTMHQPRPQKQVSVATIELPDQASFQAPQPQEQQPFHQQVPMQYGMQPTTDASYYAPMGQMQMQGYPNGNTPLSNIPEGAINAQPFQPGLAPQSGYYPYAYQQPMYYYPPPTQQSVEGQASQFGGSQVTSPVYVPQAQYFIPMLMPVPTAAEDGSSSSAPQPAMYAHESNGAVYYYDPSQLVDGSTTAVQGGGGGGAPGDAYFQPATTEAFYYSQ